MLDQPKHPFLTHIAPLSHKEQLLAAALPRPAGWLSKMIVLTALPNVREFVKSYCAQCYVLLRQLRCCDSSFVGYTDGSGDAELCSLGSLACRMSENFFLFNRVYSSRDQGEGWNYPKSRNNNCRNNEL